MEGEAGDQRWTSGKQGSVNKNQRSVGLRGGGKTKRSYCQKVKRVEYFKEKVTESIKLQREVQSNKSFL